MNRIALTTIALIASVCAASAAAADPAAASFTRMFEHQPHHGPTATTVLAERDPLAGAVASSMQRGTARESVRTAAADPVADSFARMLGHQPHYGATATAQQADRDPLITAVVLPLLRDQVVETRIAGAVRRGAN